MNNRIDLLKEVKNTTNSASFAPSEQRIKAAKAAISQLINYVDSLEVPTPKPSKKAKSQPKAAKSQPKAQSKTVDGIKVHRDSVSGMYQVTKGETVLGEYKKRKTARAMATKFSKAEGQPKAVASPKVTKRKPKAKKTSSSNYRAKLNPNQRLEVQQARASVAESYIETPKQSAKQNKPEVSETPFELTEGQCPIEAARHAKHLAMQEIFDLETEDLIFEEDVTMDDLSGQISLF